MRAALAYSIGAAVTLTGGVADLAYINVSLVPRMLEESTTVSAAVVDRVERQAIELAANTKPIDVETAELELRRANEKTEDAIAVEAKADDAIDSAEKAKVDAIAVKAGDAIDSAEAEPSSKVYQVVAVIRFKFGSSDLDDRALTEIASVTERLREDPHLRARAHGHADERGPSPFNLDLSQRRARAVAAEIERLGIEAERVESRGFGEQMASERWSLDRRVEISIGKHSQDGGPGK
jgi:outer membrane protein OmpA-like peptidoglycan-associated protein